MRKKVAIRKFCLFCLCLFLLGACKESQYDHKGRTPLVELDGNFLYKEDLMAVQPAGQNRDDSLLFAEHYIRNWAEDILLYEKAQNNVPNNDEIEKLVRNYRKALIMHIYQQALIHQKLSEEITEEELKKAVSAMMKAEACGRIFRVKGFIQKPTGEWLQLNATHDAISLKPIEAGQKVLIVIGENLCEEAIRKFLPETSAAENEK